MKFLKKSLWALLIMGTISVGLTQKVQACDKSSGCYATSENITCSIVFYLQGSTHTVTEPNGYVAQCSVIAKLSPHTITCAECGAELYKEIRTCSIKHSHDLCSDQYNLCQH